MQRWMVPAAAGACVVLCLLIVRVDELGVEARKLPTRAAVGAYILGPTSLVTGSTVSYRVAVHWASAPETSGPLPGATVGLSLAGRDKQRHPIGSGRTDATGNLQVRCTLPGLPTGSYTLAVQVDSSLGRSTQETPVQVFPGGRVLVTTDKRLYQPGQTIHMRALALRSIDLRPVAGSPVTLRVVDPKGNVLYREESRTSHFGIAALDFALADEINLGQYRVEAWVSGAGTDGRAAQQVEVKRYVLPKFKVSVETERSYYAPGDTVRGTVRARYFFGKPVAGGWVGFDVRSRHGRGVVTHVMPPRRTDSEGRATFEVSLPRGGSAGDTLGELWVLARVTDTASHRQRGDIALPLTDRPVQLGLIAENSELVPGLPNRVHVAATYPDGKPVVGADLELRTVAGTKLRARTDGLGVASFAITPPLGSRCRGSAGLALGVVARDKQGQRGALGECASLAGPRGVLVRPAASLVAPGEAVRVEVIAGAPGMADGELLYLDVVKGGQTLAAFARPARGGRASFTFQPDAALFGLLELRAYRVSTHGERSGGSRMVYADHPGQLRISASADRTVYRPGTQARIQLQATDSRSGEGVQAALGLLAVDEAVVALGGLAISSPKIFFTLASEARGGALVAPGGRDLAGWVASEEPAGSGSTTSARGRALDVLLAAVQPAPARLWETNPWKERREAWGEQAPALVAAGKAYMATHSVGQRTDKGWRFHAELVPRMGRDGAIKGSQVHDPWRRVVRPWQLRATDASFTFAPLADRLARDKLERIYRVLEEHWTQLKLAREKIGKLPRRKWPLVLPRDLLARLVAGGLLKPSDIIDPWGQRYRILLHPRVFVDPYYSGLVSRTIIHSAGPDGISGTKDDLGPEGRRRSFTALGIDAEVALGGLIGNEIGETCGVGGLGLVGTGRGAGGFGEGTIGLGALATIGKGSGHGGSMPERVRSLFPETLLWRPELVTDRLGRATLDVDLADSITDWRVLAAGSTTDGLLGQTSLALRVFQDFFVDIDLPVALTQGDRLSIPVSVYNYLKTQQRVTLRLQPESWFDPAGPVEQSIELGPSQVGVRHFPIVARRVGRHDLTVRATTGKLSDAVRRTTLVEADGVERALSLSGSLRAPVSHDVVLPESVIDGTQHAHLAIYAGPMGHTMDGLEGMLQKPYGCFEQTSSTTYPNVLVLDYLRRAGRATPKVVRRARELISLGYQRLIGFEVPGGGFSWFGRAPANRVLTAYGLMEFADMARVFPVDPNLIARTQRWLAAAQRPDGSWGPDSYNLHDGATNNFDRDVVRITAYLAHALRFSGYRGAAVTRALGYVERHANRVKDAYTLALLGNLLGVERGALARRTLDRLWSQRRTTPKGIMFAGPPATLTYGAGESGSLETTALAALALLRSPVAPDSGDRVVDAIVAGKDSLGSWHSTQATILSLRALLAHQERNKDNPVGKVVVLVDGKAAAQLQLRGERDSTQQIDLSAQLRAGQHRIAVRFAGKGNVQYHLAGRYFVPRQPSTAAGRAGNAGLSIATSYDRQQVKPGEETRLQVVVRNSGGQRVEMPLVSLALPPGFSVQEEDLTTLAADRSSKIDKVQRVGGRALLYLSKLAPREQLRLSVRLTGRYPLRVQARPSLVYEYYRPENRAESAPRVLQVM